MQCSAKYGRGFILVITDNPNLKTACCWGNLRGTGCSRGKSSTAFTSKYNGHRKDRHRAKKSREYNARRQAWAQQAEGRA